MEYDKALVSLTADIVVAHVSNNNIAQAELPQLIGAVHQALLRLRTPDPVITEVRKEPAVPIRASIKPDHLVCLEDGKKLRMLKRHLMVNFNLTPDAYRAKWNLPKDYPMVAPSYAARRRELALQIGLGRSGRAGRTAEKSAEPENTAQDEPQS